MKIIHRFWAGPKSMPEEYVEYGKKWAELNPDYKVIDWDENYIKWNLAKDPRLSDIVDDLYTRDAGRQGIELYVQLADVVGYALVEAYGGVYVNCDIQPIKPLGPIGSLDKAWASYENEEDWRIVNSAIGAPKAHNAAWKGLVDGLADRYFASPLAEMVETTGPAYLTDYVAVNRDSFVILPRDYFNPIHWSIVQPGSDASEHMENLPYNTYGVHHWGHKKDGRSNTVETATQ